MATLAELSQEIIAKVADGDVVNPTALQVVNQINSTVTYYSDRPFWFSEATATLTTTVNDPILSGIPSDFKQIIEPNGLVILDDQVRYPLKHITPLQYDSMNVQAQSIPRFYTYRNGRFELYFYPDQEYPAYLFYRKKYAALVSNGDSNDFTNYAPRLILYKTLADILRDYRSDYERAAVYDNLVGKELEEIKLETYNRTATGMLVTENIVDNTGFYDSYY